MDYKTFATNSIYCTLNGFILPPDEKAHVQASMAVLKNENHFVNIQFWGKIQGLKQDYLIVKGFAKSAEEATYFYSFVLFHFSYFKIIHVSRSANAGITFSQLPQIESSREKYLEKIRGMFIGDASFAYFLDKTEEDIEEEKQKLEAQKQSDMEQTTSIKIQDLDAAENAEQPPAEEKPAEEGGEAQKPKEPVVSSKVKIIEEDRLSFAISLIEQDTNVIPRGSYIKTSTGSIIPNDTFFGLTHNNSLKLDYYQHLKASTSQKTTLLDPSYDFADTLLHDKPNGCWALQFDEAFGCVVGKSLLYPGYVFYHIPETRTYGSFYIGSGEKNMDLCFMI